MYKKPHTSQNQPAAQDTLALILAGGSGSRLHDLTRWHAKPAVPFGGKYKTIDFPLSNCINSGIRRICILTQYKSHSLNSHITKGWHFMRPEFDEFVDLLPAQQRTKDSWYLGTADAVAQNMDIILTHKPEYVLILAGDHVYKMNYQHMLSEHINNAADMTIGCLSVPLKAAREFGVMSVDAQSRILDFTEKPDNPPPLPHDSSSALASMGIYIFNTEFLKQALHQDSINTRSSHDFGKDIIPALINDHNIFAHHFVNEKTGTPGYWRDVGTIDSYYQANMELLEVTPALDLYDTTWPTWTYQEQLPPTKFVFDDNNRRGMAVDSIVAAGTIISGGLVRHSLLSNNVRVNSYAVVEDSVILPNVEIGRDCQLNKVVVDSGCVIPPGTVIGKDLTADSQHYHVSPEGVVLVSPEMLANRFHNVA